MLTNDTTSRSTPPGLSSQVTSAALSAAMAAAADVPQAIAWFALDCAARVIERAERGQEPLPKSMLDWCQRRRGALRHGDEREVRLEASLWAAIQSPQRSKAWHGELAIVWLSSPLDEVSIARHVAHHARLHTADEEAEERWQCRRLSFLCELARLTDRMWLAEEDACPIPIPSDAEISYQLDDKER